MKPILATNIDGFLIKHEAFTEPHKAWFERAIKKTGDRSLEQWKGRKDYFKGVDIAMEKLMPDATPEERTIQARRWYQQDVVQYVKENQGMVYENVKKILKKLKSKFTLALVTVNSQEYISQILEAADLKGIYDIVYAIPSSEKPDKTSLFQRFTKEYGKPKLYIAARSKEAFEECTKIGSLCVYAAWDEFELEISKIARETIKKPSQIELIVKSSSISQL